jgi:hypothetical protein
MELDADCKDSRHQVYRSADSTLRVPAAVFAPRFVAKPRRIFRFARVLLRAGHRMIASIRPFIRPSVRRDIEPAEQ